MALFVRQDSTRTKLQERLAAELNERAKQKSELENREHPDGVNDSQYIQNTKQTTSLAWVWLLIAIATVAIIVWLVIQSSN